MAAVISHSDVTLEALNIFLLTFIMKEILQQNKISQKQSMMKFFSYIIYDDVDEESLVPSGDKRPVFVLVLGLCVWWFEE